MKNILPIILAAVAFIAVLMIELTRKKHTNRMHHSFYPDKIHIWRDV